MKYIICYDISSAKRLVKIAKKLEQNGFRVQKSFFSCTLNIDEINLLKNELVKTIELEKDKLAIYPICDKCVSNGYYIGCNASDFFDKDYFIL